MIVVDASALVDALLDDGPAGDAARAALTDDPAFAAPACLPMEVLAVTRRRLLRGQVQPRRAADAVEVLSALAVSWVDPGALVGRIWELRDRATAFDAAYVAAAEMLDCALVTADHRPAAASGVRCPVRLVGVPAARPGAV